MTTIAHLLRAEPPEQLGSYELVSVPRAEFLAPSDPAHYGERVLWSDGSLRLWPEDDHTDPVTVLRRQKAVP